MPPTKDQRTSALVLNVNIPQGVTFHPGELITGNVLRPSYISSPNATVTIKLQGRTKAKVEKHEYRGGKRLHVVYYRSRFQLFEVNPNETGRTLHQGPLHIETYNDLSRAWNFSIQIPFFTGLDLSSPYNSESTYVDMSPEAVAKHPLPPTFHPLHVNGFVEYYLEATLHYVNDKGTPQTDKSILVVPMGMARLPAPIFDWKPKLETESAQAVSYFLVPGTQKEKMGFRQKTKQFFQTTSVPTLKYKVAVSTPSVIQLNHADCLPIYIKLTSDLEGSTDALRKLPFKAVITHMEIVAKHKTAIKGEGMNYISGEGKIEEDTEPVELGLEKVWATLREPIEVQVAPTASSVNLSAKLDLRLRHDGLYMGATKVSDLKRDLVPSFKTYNITHEYIFHYTIKWKIVDCEEAITFNTATTILPEAMAAQPVVVQPVPVPVADVQEKAPKVEEVVVAV
ncbi:hypothetical protein VHEMI01649 [[Torrubiella] hemipterigena]|uniref:Arrestin-like N-terminal domain-containing protein n=1 Tax=[Torrubiella] hemipterigena TaxID=1531966 RepID=A0A0A1SMF6_9HYPO|nr:hypothetical protein VHEMI01649 [[Torrubiella] hemipterigena]